MNTVQMDKFTQFRVFEIWQPRYHDNRVLLKATKVGAHNKVIFTKAKSLPDTYYLSGKTIKKYPKEYNSSIFCYAVPLEELKLLQLTQNSQFEI